jgi:hypothetical protein
MAADDVCELLKEALRAEVEQAPKSLGVKRPQCERCGARRTPTWPCKECYPEDWNERMRISRLHKTKLDLES